MAAKIAGVIEVQVNGEVYAAKGDFTYNLGVHKREGIMGADGRLHGFKETPQIAHLEGKLTDRNSFDVKALLNLQNATVTVRLANSKAVVFRSAYFAGEGNVTTGEAEIDFRIESESAEEV
jgi:hypothetical protein